MSIGDRNLDHVWVVNRVDEYDGIYVFEDEHRARDYATRYSDAVLTEEVVMNDSAAAQFLIDTADDDPDDLDPHDHSAAREDARNGLEPDHSKDKEDRRSGFEPPPPQRSLSLDAAGLDQIADILRDPEWGVGMLEDIAAIVDETGRDTEGDGRSTWHRH